MSQPLTTVILAAGKGTRMKSSLPKVLHKIGAKSMVKHVIDASHNLDAQKLILIYGHGGEQLQASLADESLIWVEQKEQLGTGHAVQQIIPEISDDEQVLILYGDVPLISPETLQKLLLAAPDKGIGLLTVKLANPTGYGRIIRDTDGNVVAIVEEKDADDSQKQVNEVNTGILTAPANLLKSWLADLSNDNAQQEYYLTDIIAMCAEQGYPIETANPAETCEVEGVNNRLQQATLERIYQQKQVEALMVEGVTFRDPARVDVRGSVKVGQDVAVDINVVFEGNIELGNNVSIEPNCILRNCKIADGTLIKANTIIEDAVIGEACFVGPFARIRPGSEFAEGVHIGNFVETKNTKIAKGSKANHLAYLGDSDVGAGVNVGAGTITCNYDGANKFRTTIEDNVFVGSNSSIVAPVTLAKGTTVGAGSTIVKSSTENELVIARAKQRHIAGWQRPVKKK
ncbi:bifunctional UDP-N-acetylglucosamine diphosphorylase/glucosamine-1-phosphate N-acetyltransferase GlmU [Catenovulum sp. 2E275]|uniref:bifunctional UDP-N-acetylglucosamine diphosphorylase/glucosamine-1-phosphate N-acetyltransferase GlmU n=1 Tax=Catenovulum sp. 2E275 TaxID=2980497 RepID=UPI0021CFDE5F|nr:bifunctional UDP-N-acetylglucosamine diphosphorylase/glucosamine-1-phosphate N-acetyltransferase GlmU [Catenovulum sp. 2E275]MCU4676213.1 bifunctional UDP-N-acetylglucosamine diphosphorylase/glucosamine-1-phosphate N-acetyltransferase GlmU [Catenovulum sp. 2E275]